MKNSSTPNSAQTWIIGTVKHHSTSRYLIPASHLLTAQTNSQRTYVTSKTFFSETITSRPVHQTQILVVRGLPFARDRELALNCKGQRISEEME